jgi:hypothetical protein
MCLPKQIRYIYDQIKEDDIPDIVHTCFPKQINQLNDIIVDLCDKI